MKVIGYGDNVVDRYLHPSFLFCTTYTFYVFHYTFLLFICQYANFSFYLSAIYCAYCIIFQLIFLYFKSGILIYSHTTSNLNTGWYTHCRKYKNIPFLTNTFIPYLSISLCIPVKINVYIYISFLKRTIFRWYREKIDEFFMCTTYISIYFQYITVSISFYFSHFCQNKQNILLFIRFCRLV